MPRFIRGLLEALCLAAFAVAAGSPGGAALAGDKNKDKDESDAEEGGAGGGFGAVKVGDWARYEMEASFGADGRTRTTGRTVITVTEKTDKEAVLRIDTQRIAPGRDGGRVLKESRELRAPLNKRLSVDSLLPEMATRDGVKRKAGKTSKSELLAAGKAFACEVVDIAWEAGKEARDGDKDKGKDKDKDAKDGDGPGERRPPPRMPDKGTLKRWTSADFPFRLIQWEASYEMAMRDRSVPMKQILRLEAFGDRDNPDPKADEEIKVPERPGGAGQGADVVRDNSVQERGGGGRPGGGGRGGRR